MGALIALCDAYGVARFLSLTNGSLFCAQFHFLTSALDSNYVFLVTHLLRTSLYLTVYRILI